MNGSRWLVITFVLVLGGIVGGYMVWQVYAPPASAARPVVPQERQFSLVLARVGSEESAQVLRWIPGTLIVHVGDTVILRVTNADPDGSHGFGMPEAGIAIKDIPSGQTAAVRFEARSAGIFYFSCTIARCAKDHPDQTGELVVLATP